MSEHLEIEDKYDVPAGVEPPDLTVLPGVAAVSDPVEARLTARYYDTRELALARQGITLRRRTGGADDGWHLKLPGKDGRLEVHEPLGRRVRRRPPQRLLELVAAHTRRERPVRTATVTTRRTTRQLLDGSGGVLAEVTDDLVESDGRAWREWEVELVGGDRALLRAAGEELVRAGAEVSRHGSKLRRVLGDRLPEPGSGRGGRRKDPAAAVVHDILREHLALLYRYDPLVRCAAPDAVHQLRIAVRRLRSSLATYRALLDRETTEPLRDELRWLGRELGPARDTEVMRDRLLAMVAAEPPELVRGPVRQLVEERLGAEQQRAQAAATEALRSTRYFALLDALGALVEDPPWTAEADRKAKKVLPGLVRAEWRRVRKRVRRATGDEELHDVRKAARRARYAAEALAPLWGRDARRFAKRMKAVQSALGVHRDALVTADRLRRLSSEASTDGLETFTLGVLQARTEATRVVQLRAFHAAWAEAARPRVRRWLG